MKVYIAGPYSAKTEEERLENVLNMLDYANKVMAMGGTPFVPLLCHWWDIYSPKSYHKWLEMDLEWITSCDCLFRMPGDSNGAQMEMRYALEHHILVFHSLDTFQDFIEGKHDPYNR